MSSLHNLPLAVQVTLPEDFKNDGEFRSDLTFLKEKGFWGVELNIKDPFSVPREQVEEYLAEFGLSLSMFASGLTAKTLGLSLSSADEELRARSVERCKAMLDWVGDSGAGVVLGFLKGPVSDEPERARERFAASIEELAPHVEQRGAKLIVEATNRYETSVANSVDEAATYVRPHSDRGVCVLADTFHMNIEEADAAAALIRNEDLFASFHLSDNNRLYPGLGGIEFRPILRLLASLGFEGRLGLEAKTRVDFKTDVAQSVAYLEPLLNDMGGSYGE